MKLLAAAGLVEHVVMRPSTKSHGITCWGWSSPDIRDDERYYQLVSARRVASASSP